MTEINEIGFRLKKIREEKGMIQNDLVERLEARKLNMSRETLSKIENGNRSISAIELGAICNILDVDINSFFKENEPEVDLMTLFRKANFSENVIEEVEPLQEMIKLFIYQKKVYKGEFKPQSRKPLWEEF